MRQFYGNKEILGVVEDHDFVELNFAEGKAFRIPKRMFEVTWTSKKIELGELRDKRLKPITKEILEVFLKWDIKLDEIDPLTELILTSINASLAEADDKVWDIKRSERTVSQVHEILKKSDTGTIH